MILIKLYHRENNVTIQNILDNIGIEFLKENSSICSPVQAMALSQ